MAKKQINRSRVIPTGVKILSVLAYIGAVLSLVVGLAMIFGASFISSLIPAGTLPMMGGLLVGAGLIFAGIIAVLLAILDYFVGRGLWNGQNWARILVLIFAVLGILGSLMPFNIVSIVIDGVIIWYLGFKDNAKAYFK
ncbi:hypothetical protein KA107_02740 [Candidatus Pacearchaeota archaeon]|nr:hypothetical protein [Candidatus Pacearchaeota archaeon]